ncbi:hypothetical protein ACSHT2_09270 [Bradyrhizobium sp. PUT101]|uniref:hypothetical protein n=1 Tax=Bradyrhizobium sp. PUT101 TaxID=3447427 RepID=UPI003F86536F
MDGALFSLLFFFFVQISAGVAPMRWPECKWLAGVIFWISSAGAAACLIWYGYSQSWFSIATGMMGRQGFGILVLACAIALGVVGLSMIALGDKPAQAPKQAETPSESDPNRIVRKHFSASELARRRRAIDDFKDWITGPALDVRDQAKHTLEAISPDAGKFQTQAALLKEKVDIADKSFSRLALKWPDYAETTGITEQNWQLPERRLMMFGYLDLIEVLNTQASNFVRDHQDPKASLSPKTVEQLRKFTRMMHFWVPGRSRQLSEKWAEYEQADVGVTK